MLSNNLSAKERSGSRYKWNFLVILLMLIATVSSFAQDAKEMEKVMIGDSRFILHLVQKNETLYSIARRYDCSQEEVLAANKNITGIIKKGMVLKIPDHAFQKPLPANFDEHKYQQHLIVSGDNYYQLKLKYNVEEEELVKLNPELKDGLKAGRIIRVPIKSREEAEAKSPPVNELPGRDLTAPKNAGQTSQIINVGLYLPISASVADTLKPSNRTLSFLAFYQGALMAIDQLSKTGLKVKLYVYDTEKSNSVIESLTRKPEFLSLDLLIGPVYPEHQKQLSELSAKNKIPMVSPFSQDDRYAKTNPYYFQVNPVKKIRIEATADYLLKEFKDEKIIFLESEKGGMETRQIQEYLGKKRALQNLRKGSISSCNLWTKGIEALESMLQTDKPNILVMADNNEVNVSIAMNRLTLLSKKYPLLLIGVQELTRMQSIETENLHNVNLRFLSTYFVDYARQEIPLFVENFKSEFATEPSLFAFQGYDVMTYFLRCLQKKENLLHGIPPEGNLGLLNGAYHFTRVSDFGGYSNDNFTVVEYSNSFEVRSMGFVRHVE